MIPSGDWPRFLIGAVSRPATGFQLAVHWIALGSGRGSATADLRQAMANDKTYSTSPRDAVQATVPGSNGNSWKLSAPQTAAERGDKGWPTTSLVRRPKSR